MSEGWITQPRYHHQATQRVREISIGSPSKCVSVCMGLLIEQVRARTTRPTIESVINQQIGRTGDPVIEISIKSVTHVL